MTAEAPVLSTSGNDDRGEGLQDASYYHARTRSRESPTATPLDDDDDITLTATVGSPTVGAVANALAPFKRVYFYAESNTIAENAPDGTDEENDGPRHWRLIASLGKGAYERRTAGDSYLYEVEIEAGDIFAIVDDDGEGEYTGNVIAIGVRDDYELPVLGDDPSTPETVETDFATAVMEEYVGLVGLVSTETVTIPINP